MKLKEQFEQILIEDFKSDWETGCEKVADEFDIGFSKFIETRCTKTDYLHQYIFDGKEHHLTSLLKIYKKESNL